MDSVQTDSAGTQDSSPGLTRAEVFALFERRQQAYDDLDAARLAADYSADCVIDSPLSGIHRGPAAAEAGLRAFFEAFLDLKVRTEGLIVDGHHVAHTLTAEGTHVGRFLGLAPMGRPFRLAAVFLYELKGPHIVREQRIYDFTGLLVQVGVLKAKPI
jgi:predicted ester cyclase